MDAFEDVVYDDRAIFLPGQDVLVVADLHVGRDATSGVELPMGEIDDILDRLEGLLGRHQPETLVVAGDLLHAFDSVPYGVHEAVGRLADLVESAGVELSVTAGNHDPILEDISEFETAQHHELADGTIIHHGHEIPKKSGDRYIIGHEHPAIFIEGVRHPCFLECPAQREDANVLVLPAFNRLAVGTVVNSMDAADSMSPLVTDLDTCRPVVSTGAEPLYFPALEELRAHL